MAYCGIMRVEKRGRSAVGGLEAEANRKEEDHKIKGRDFARSDIDWDLTKNNIFLVKTEGWQQAITKQIKEAEVRERKNSTIMIDAFYGASADFFKNHPKEDWLKFFDECLNFHIKHYCLGDKKRVLNAVIHLDEKTPHMQIASVPIFEDEKGFHLSARDILGGRVNFRKRQDNFFEEVSQKWGLERGEVRDWENIKKHTTKREWQLATQEEEIRRLEEEKNFAIANQKLEIKEVEEEKLKALRSRDNAIADFEVEKEINKLKKILLDEYLDLSSLILEEREPKEAIKINALGIEKELKPAEPAKVILRKEDFEEIEFRLDSQERLKKMFEDFDLALENMRKKAQEIHQNDLDSYAVATNERVIMAELEKHKIIEEEKEKRERLEKELKKANTTLTEKESLITLLNAQLSSEKTANNRLRKEAENLEEIVNCLGLDIEELEQRTRKIREMEKFFKANRDSRQFNFKGKFLSKKQFLQDYIAECEKQEIKPLKIAREDLQEELTRGRGVSR